MPGDSRRITPTLSPFLGENSQPTALLGGSSQFVSDQPHLQTIKRPWMEGGPQPDP